MSGKSPSLANPFQFKKSFRILTKNSVQFRRAQKVGAAIGFQGACERKIVGRKHDAIDQAVHFVSAQHVVKPVRGQD